MEQHDVLQDEYPLAASKAFVLTFEPLLDKYAVLLARGTKRFHGAGSLDQAVPLAHHHQRGVVLPIAVSPAHGSRMATINVSRIAGCSSLPCQ